MSKSTKRVLAAAKTCGLSIELIETPSGTHTAAMAADFCGCAIAQIAKSILFRDESNTHYLLVTSGANRVDAKKAETLVGIPLLKADAASIREVTGFAIGGVAPVGSITPLKTFIDPDLMVFDMVYAAGGTPHTLFAISPKDLQTATQGEIAEFTELPKTA